MMNNVNRREPAPVVVLVADRTLSADYRVLFEGIFATMQTTQVPEAVMRHFVSRPVKTDTLGRARTAPLGLRRVESALLEHGGLGAGEIVCTTPDALDRVLGPSVKVVAVSSSDPLGQGMSNTTTKNFWKGELYTRYWTRDVLRRIGEAKRRYGFKVVGGGAGAWQWDRYADATAAECIDVVFEGYFESQGPQLVKDLIEGHPRERVVREAGTCLQSIRPIRGASLLGIIELSRGCGRGCKFCTMADRKMAHLPVETICADLETNVAAGVRSVVSGSEDFFRYGAEGVKPEFKKLHGLLERMREIKGLSFMQIDHANISSAAQMTDEELCEVRQLLNWEERSDYLWVNMGVESANGHLVAQSSPGKLAPFRPEDWEDLVRQTVERMGRNGFFSVVSLILGLPGETPNDVERTLKLVHFLEDQKAVVFPVFYEPLLAEQIKNNLGFTVDKMRADHLELYSRCYEINFRKVPLLFWDNQRAGGVSWFKRTAMQLLGKTEVYSWRKTFRKVGRQIAQRKTAVEMG
ncbi:MAG: radical SAM protein [Phycisphaerae bacterium]|nr:radical SAM protein [Phycisphaerae bacterium]